MTNATGRLQRGDTAPNFTVTDYRGAEVKLSALRGNRLLLSFYRYAACPFCNLRVREIMTAYDELEAKGLRTVAFFESDDRTIARYAGKMDPSFPIVGDPERNTYRLYRTESSWRRFLVGMISLAVIGKFVRGLFSGVFPGRPENDIAQMPADFLVNEQGVVVRAYYGGNLSDHLSLEEIRAFATAPAQDRRPA